MATREIKTSLKIDGEKAYKTALSSVNSELRTLKSEMKLAESQFKGQANSIKALTAKQKILKQQYDQQKEKVKSLNQAYKEAKEVYGENSKQADKYKQSLNYAKVALDNLDGELKQNDKYLDEAKSSTDGCAKSIDKFGKETEQAAKKSNILKKIFMGGFLANIASQAITALTSRLKEFGSESVKLASDVQEVQNVVDVTFGDMAGVVDKWAKSADEAFGLSELNAKKFTSTLGAMLKSAGITGTELTDMSTKLAGVSADFASFYNLSVDEAFNKVRQGISGETEGLKALGINLNQANLMQTEYAVNLGKTWKEMTTAEQATTRYKAILELGNDALGDFNETSDSYANKVKIMELKTENLKTALGERLLPAAENVVDGLTDLMSVSGETGDSFSELEKSLGATANTQSLIDKYRNLSVEIGSSSLSASELKAKTAELEQAKQDLITASGGVVTAFDIENGTFDQQIKVLEGATQAEREYVQFKLKGIILENTGSGAIGKAVKAREKHADALKTFNAQQELVNDAQERLNEGEKKTASGVSLEMRVKEGGKALERFRGDLTDATNDVRDAAKEAAEGEAALKSYVENGFGTAEDAAAEFGLELEDVNEMLGETGEAVESTIPEINDMSVAIDELNAEYEAAYSSALESLEGQIGMWDSMSIKATTSVAEMQEALDSQVAWFENYNTNLETAMTVDIPGVDMQPLLDSISEGTPEAAGRAAALAEAISNGDTEMVKNLALTAAEVGTHKEELASTMAEVSTDYSERYQEIVKTTADGVKDMDKSAEAKKSGEDTIQGYINGANRKSGALYATMGRIARQTLATWKREMDSHSPSRKMIKEGENAIEGAIIGVNNMQAELKEAYAAMGKTLLDGLSVGMKNGSGKLMETTDDISKELLSRLSDMSSVFSTSGDISELQYKLWGMTSGENATADDKANKEISSLTGQSSIQQKQIEATKTALGKMNELYGESSEESLKLQKQLLQEKIAYEELQQAIEDINKAKKAGPDTSKLADMAEDEFKLWFKETPDATDAEKLEKQSEVLTFKLGLQSDAVGDTEQALKDAATQYGKNSEESIKIQEQLLKEKIAYADLKIEIQELNTARGQYGSFNSSTSSSGFLQAIRDLESLSTGKINTDLSSINSLNKQDVGGMIAGAVNAMATIGGTQQPIVVQNPLYINGRELARATLNDFRAVNASNPQTRSDKI